jgi:hypothetical protein
VWVWVFLPLFNLTYRQGQVPRESKRLDQSSSWLQVSHRSRLAGSLTTLRSVEDEENSRVLTNCLLVVVDAKKKGKTNSRNTWRKGKKTKRNCVFKAREGERERERKVLDDDEIYEGVG